MVKAELSPAKLVWRGNLMHGSPIGAEAVGITSDPLMKKSSGLMRPDAAGPAANAAIKCSVEVAKDIDGQNRPETQLDIGADEVSGQSGDLLYVPLSPADVGVSFLQGTGPETN